MGKRITIETTEELDQALEEIRVATGRPSIPEVIRDSLELYDMVMQQLFAGKRLFFGEDSASAREVQLLHLERARTRSSRMS